MSSLHPSAVFDPTDLLSLMAGDPVYTDTVLALLQSIIDNGTRPVDEARQLWCDGRTTDAARRLHQARGSLGSFGIKRFSAIALELEMALTQNPQRVAQLFADARQDLQAAIDAIRAWIETQSPGVPKTKS